MYWLLIPAGCVGAIFLMAWLQRVLTNGLIEQLEEMVEKGRESTKTYDSGYLFDARQKLDLARQHRTEARWSSAYSVAKQGRDLLKSPWARYRS